MKTGDLLQHHPFGSKDEHIKAIYEEHDADFRIGLIIKERESFRLVSPEKGKPAWYQVEELKIISKS